MAELQGCKQVADLPACSTDTGGYEGSANFDATGSIRVGGMHLADGMQG